MLATNIRLRFVCSFTGHKGHTCVCVCGGGGEVGACCCLHGLLLEGVHCGPVILAVTCGSRGTDERGKSCRHHNTVQQNDKVYPMPFSEGGTTKEWSTARDNIGVML